MMVDVFVQVGDAQKQIQNAGLPLGISSVAIFHQILQNHLRARQQPFQIAGIKGQTLFATLQSGFGPRMSLAEEMIEAKIFPLQCSRNSLRAAGNTATWRFPGTHQNPHTPAVKFAAVVA